MSANLRERPEAGKNICALQREKAIPHLERYHCSPS
jgi:hypothetical protein